MEDTARLEDKPFDNIWLHRVTKVPGQKGDSSGGLRIMANAWLFGLYGFDGLIYTDEWVERHFCKFIVHVISIPYLYNVADRCPGCKGWYHPKSMGDYIQCKDCYRWFHISCSHIPEGFLNNKKAKFMCNSFRKQLSCQQWPH